MQVLCERTNERGEGLISAMHYDGETDTYQVRDVDLQHILEWVEKSRAAIVAGALLEAKPVAKAQSKAKKRKRAAKDGSSDEEEDELRPARITRSGRVSNPAHKVR